MSSTDTTVPPEQDFDDSASKYGYFWTLFNAVPIPIIIVDEEVRIFGSNAAGRSLLGMKELIKHERGGDVLHCLNAISAPNGCGSSERCTSCVIRNSVRTAANGGKVIRMRAHMQMQGTDDLTDFYMLVTASPFVYEGRQLVLLQLENISELIALKSLLPICAWCKRIRDDDNYWQSVESYLKVQADVDFSHGICPECAEKWREERKKLSVLKNNLPPK